MNRLPPDLVGRGVAVVLNPGTELKGKCILTREDYLVLQNGSWECTVEVEAIAAIGVNREDKV